MSSKEPISKEKEEILEQIIGEEFSNDGVGSELSMTDDADSKKGSEESEDYEQNDDHKSVMWVKAQKSCDEPMSEKESGKFLEQLRELEPDGDEADSESHVDNEVLSFLKNELE